MLERSSHRPVLRSATLLALTALLLTGVSSPVSGAGAVPVHDVAVDKGDTSVYVVQLRDEPAAAYDGGRAGYAATKPAPGQKLDRTSARVTKYASFLTSRQQAALRRSGAPDTARIYSYLYSFNGFAAVLTAAQVARLHVDAEVIAVTQDTLSQPLTDNTPAFLGLSAPGGLWGQLGGQGAAGEGVIVGVIDTGIWPEHPSFSDQSDLADRSGSSAKRLRSYGAPPSYWRGSCQSGERWSRDDCNNKLIGARYFLDGFRHRGIIKDDFESPRDADGHGSHTASTSAGNAGVDPQIFGRDLGVDTISGMAPRARIAAYKACWEDGCATSDLTAAIDAAVSDGVDVINYSIGSSTPSLLSPDAVAFLFAAEANVFVAASAGNSGPGASTLGSPANSPWLTSVGASTHDRTFQGSVRLGDGATYAGASVTPGLAATPLVDGEAAGSRGCEPGELDPAMVSGKVVLCEGSRLRAARGLAVKAAGGVGMVLHNEESPVDLFSDNHHLPAVHVTLEDGAAIKAYLTAAGGGATAAITAGSAAAQPSAPNITEFSSRGPNGAAGDIIKPDVTAPGMQILAATTPAALHAAPGQLFQAISGTSMSSPHVAGVAALLVQAHRDWTPAMIRSALTTTGHQDVDKEDGTTPADPFDMGGGHIRPNPADDPGLVYDAGFLDYIAFLCGTGELAVTTCTTPAPAGFGVQPIDPSDLNQATFGIDSLAGQQTVTRRVTNAGAAGTYSVSVAAPAGVDVTVSPTTLSLATGASASYTVTFTSTPAAPVDQWAFGALTWADGAGHSVRSPIAVKPVALYAPDEFTGTGTSGSGTWDVTFGYTGPFTADPLGLVPATRESATVADDPADDVNVALGTGVGIRDHTIAVAPGTVHLRASLFDEDTDGNDDLDLYLFDPAGNFVDGSGSVTSAEQVDAPSPVAGNWRLVVHGWETDGADAAYALSTWAVPSTSAGNLTVTAPATATLGASAAIDVAWAGLTAGTRYLGAVAYTNGATEFDRTLVAVNS